MPASIASDAYARWIGDLIARGLEPWLVTFMFRQLPGSPAARQAQMLETVEKFYGIRLTRIIKHPRASSNRDQRPIWLAAPDLPIFKWLKQTLCVVVVNDGQHIHVIVLEPADRPCSECFAEFEWAERQLWRRLCPNIERIDVRAITHDVERVTSYVLKQIERRVSADGILILPRTNSELRRGQPSGGRNSSIYGPLQGEHSLRLQGRQWRR